MQVTHLTAVQKQTRPRLSGETRFRRQLGLLLISPWLIGFILLKLVPILASLGLSFTDFYLLEPAQTQFVELKNYSAVFRDEAAAQALWQTISLALLIIPAQTVGAIGLATVLSDKDLAFKNTMRTLFYIPSIIPSAATLLMWQGFLNPRFGWLNQFLLAPLGLESLNQLWGRGAGPGRFVLTALWSLGPGVLIILSAMQNLSSELFEAAEIDGAGPITRFFRLTLPLISPAIFFTLVLNLTGVFGGVILLDRGNFFRNNISSYDGYVNFVLFDLFKLGSAASLAWIYFVFVMLIVLTLFATAKWWVYFPDQKG